MPLRRHRKPAMMCGWRTFMSPPRRAAVRAALSPLMGLLRVAKPPFRVWRVMPPQLMRVCRVFRVSSAWVALLRLRFLRLSR